MSIFQFKVSSLSKQKDKTRNSVFGKSFASTSNSFGTFFKEHKQLQDETSKFFIDENDLWNDDDKDVFVTDKDIKKQSNKPSLNLSKKPNKCDEIIHECDEENEDICEDSVKFNGDDSEYAKQQDSDYLFDDNIKPTKEQDNENFVGNDIEHSKQQCSVDFNGDVAEENQDKVDFNLTDCNFESPPKNECCFNLIDESDDEVLMIKTPEKKPESPKSPTFHVHKSYKKSSLTSDSKKDDSDSDIFSNFATNKSSLEKNSEEKTNFLSVVKERANPLGLNNNFDLWLKEILQNEAFSNISLESPEERLQNNLNFLNKSYVEILEKVMLAFENLPVEFLNQFPEFDPEVFMTLRTTRRRIKAVIIKTENLLKRKSSIEKKISEENKNVDCFDIESPSMSNFSRVKYSSDFGNSFDELSTNKSSEGVFSFKQTSISKNSIMENNKSALNFSQLSGNNLLAGERTKQNSQMFESPKVNKSNFDDEEIPSNTSTPLMSYNQNSSMKHLGERKASNSGTFENTNINCQTNYGCFVKNSPVPERFLASMKYHSGSGEFDGLNFPHSKDLLEKFHQKFGLKTFRPNQLQVINATLLGHDCFVLMPTGGGKSLCYQLPALVSKGVTVVISPLRSLIHDQVTKLLTLDIAAAHLSGDINESQASLVYRKLNQPEPKIKLLYVTPEKIGISSSLRNCLFGLYKRGMLARFVIDEAHCVSQWGHDFRPDYKKLRELRENFPDVNIMALTATATPRVRTDILNQLKVVNPKWFLSSFNRSNLKYSVKEKKGKSTVKEIAALIQNDFKKDTGVIYCLSRNECETLAKDLQEHGIAAIPYHAGLNDNERTRAQNLWMNDKAKVVCATVAFGMGIDKLDVRFVIHYSLPKSIEGYYQESGRAGRDGEKATCILFYSYRDKIRMLKLINMDQSMGSKATRKVHIDNLFRVVAFAENKTDCRRALQLEYFGEKFDRKECIENRNTACDNCLSQGVYEVIDVTEESKTIVSSVKEVCGADNKRSSNFTMLHFVDVFKGTLLKKVLNEGHDSLPLYGMGKSWQRLDVERLFRKLIIEEFLQERLLVKNDGITFAYINFGRRGEELLKGNIRIMFEIKKKRGSASAQASSIKAEKLVDPLVLEIQEKCYSDLMEAIHEIASSVNCNPNAIMNVQALRAMSSCLPETPEEMLSINHVTTANFEKYGSILLEITKKYASEKKALQIKVSPEKSSFVAEPWSNKFSDDSPYFETDITFAGATKGGKKRKKSNNYRRGQQSKKWKGSHYSSKASSSKASGAKSGTKSRTKSGGNGSGITTVPCANAIKMMELPTKSRGFPKPKVTLQNL